MACTEGVPARATLRAMKRFFRPELCFRALVAVEAQGSRGITCGQLAAQFYAATKDGRRNVMASQLLRRLATDGLLAAVGDDPGRCTYFLTDDGRAELTEARAVAAREARARRAELVDRPGAPLGPVVSPSADLGATGTDDAFTGRPGGWAPR